ncbi:hypothetical protein A8L45_01045 [Veronia pacifica]|uniref:HTH araC/xylS-type domain-containing protein n=2 Tax=Veronia pacifica TaxID=1080227 RepID=A0A1C3ESI8_9GAMM|nr:hypothetical protein A8L45_01045 [Veronia pacifica]
MSSFTVLLILGLVLIKQYKKLPTSYLSLWNLAFIVCILSHIVRTTFSNSIGYWLHWVNGIEYFTPVLFLICMRLQFEDGFQLTWVEKSALIISILFYISFMYLGPVKNSKTHDSMYFYYITSIQFSLDTLCVIYAYWIMFKNWSSDLIYIRRLSRLFLLVVTGPTIILCIILHFVGNSIFDRSYSSASDFIIAVAIIIHGIVILVSFLEIRQDIDPLIPSVENNEIKSSEEYQFDLELLENKMHKEFLYRDIDLSLTNLSEKLGIPIYRVRNAINKGLGYKNFHAFLNRYRIEEAKGRLLEKGNQDTILKVSIEVGYKNLSTFNKAFKDNCGITPTEYRKSNENIK